MSRLAVTNQILRLTLRPLWARSLRAGRMRRAFRLADWLGTLGRRMPTLRHERIDDVPVEWVGDPAKAADGVLVFVHGGSFSVRGPRSDRLFGADLARRSGMPVAIPAYRLAPEFPFPAGLDDCIRVYRALLSRGIPAQRMVFVGHSAGANLIAAMLMRVRDAGLPQPAGAALLSGCFDMSGPTPAALALADRDVCASPAIWPWTQLQYCSGLDPRDPGISPFFGDWTGLAPLHFQVSDSEMLFDSVRATAERAKAAAVDVSLTVWRGLPHTYPALDLLAEGRSCRVETAAFVNRVLAVSPGAARPERMRRGGQA